MSAASDYQRLRAHLAFLRMTAAAEALPDGAFVEERSHRRPRPDGELARLGRGPLAFLELQKVDSQLTLAAENRRLQASAARTDRDRNTALNGRLQTEIDENARLRKEQAARPEMRIAA